MVSTDALVHVRVRVCMCVCYTGGGRRMSHLVPLHYIPIIAITCTCVCVAVCCVHRGSEGGKGSEGAEGRGVTGNSVARKFCRGDNFS